jgi:hypothetical protein
MTTTNPPILRNSALALPAAVALAALWGGDHAVAAAISGLLTLANLWVLTVVGPRLVTAIAREELSALWAAALVAKFILLTGALIGLLRILPPLGLALGFVPLVLGTLVTALQLAALEQDDPAPGEA